MYMNKTSIKRYVIRVIGKGYICVDQEIDRYALCIKDDIDNAYVLYNHTIANTFMLELKKSIYTDMDMELIPVIGLV